MDYIMGAEDPIIIDDVKTIKDQKSTLVEAIAVNGASKEASANFEASEEQEV